MSVIWNIAAWFEGVVCSVVFGEVVPGSVILEQTRDYVVYGSPEALAARERFLEGLNGAVWVKDERELP